MTEMLFRGEGAIDWPSRELKAQQQALDLTEYFDGDTFAYGVFEDLFGRIRRRFTVEISGRWQDDKFVMNERFIFDDGETDQRVWTLSPGENGRFTATSGDCVGEARGVSSPGMVRLSYIFRLKMGGNGLNVRFDDRLYRMNDKVVINRATMRKFGLKLGELSLCFVKA